MELPSNINGGLDNDRTYMNLLDPYRFDIKHGFSMSMASAGGHPISMMTYNTNINYLIADNMALSTNIFLMNSSRGQITNKNMGYQNLKLAYDASLIFKPINLSMIVKCNGQIINNYNYNVTANTPRWREWIEIDVTNLNSSLLNQIWNVEIIDLENDIVLESRNFKLLNDNLILSMNKTKNN